jgi:hypothetical protein
MRWEYVGGIFVGVVLTLFGLFAVVTDIGSGFGMVRMSAGMMLAGVLMLAFYIWRAVSKEELPDTAELPDTWITNVMLVLAALFITYMLWYWLIGAPTPTGKVW